MKVICFGDSNTYGYDPRSWIGGRYKQQYRWTDILQKETGWSIQNWGINGQQIPAVSPEIPDDTDLLIIMLGTNDLLQGYSHKETAQRMNTFLQTFPASRNYALILISPPSMRYGEWVSDETILTNSQMLEQEYQAIAKIHSIPLICTGCWKIPLAYDGVHFTQEGHQLFAKLLKKELKP
ncbi:MAG: lipase [Oscillospiraceae bacterium]|nr:lipase [Oscillospiraceae bacterium]